MKTRILFVERKFNEFVSIEKAFREIAAWLSDKYESEFQQLKYGNGIVDILKNLILFRKKEARIYHVTGHVHYISLLLPRDRTVLSIMDLGYLSRYSGIKLFVLNKLLLHWPVRRLKYITAISEATKREIVEHTGCDPDKVWALDLPLLPHVQGGSPKEFNAECPVILQVGTMPNKNVPNLARALKGLKCKLRVIGRMTEEQIAVLKENEIDYENAFNLDDDQIKDEYERADIISFCSLHEGFGLPIIEGQIMGRPVITSNRSPMIETSGGAAYLADPEDPVSIRAGVDKIIGDAEYRRGLVEKGFENIKRYEPGAIAKQYEKLYDLILEESDR
jgi:glycosyltransferase involved in cell wall biosynthesis